MDMAKILQNMNDALAGKKPSAGAKSVNDMKTILESLQKVNEAPLPAPTVGPSSMPPVMPPKDEGDPVSMNVSINARGRDHVSDLLDLMKAAGLDSSKKLGDDDMPVISLGKMMAKDEEADESYENEPEEDYKDTQYMTRDLSGGINKEKKAFKAAQRGDNAMAVESIKERLLQALAEKKAKPDFLDVDKDGNKKEPMKKAIADKKAKK